MSGEWWVWWLIGIATVPAGLVLAWLAVLFVDPGKGWTLSCGFGHYPYGLPQYGPRCDWSISAGKRFPPEWTKQVRHRWHWWRTHPVSGRKYQRDYLVHRAAFKAAKAESTEKGFPR